MRRNPYPWKTVGAITAGLACGALLAAAPAAAAPPPVARSYFVVSLGTVGSSPSDAYELDAGCLRFSRHSLCDTDGDCGAWWPVQQEPDAARRRSLGFSFDLTDDQTGLPIRIEGRARVEARGRRSALAGVAHASEPTSGVSINFAFAGRAVGARKCERLAADFEAARRQRRGGS